MTKRRGGARHCSASGRVSTCYFPLRFLFVVGNERKQIGETGLITVLTPTPRRSFHRPHRYILVSSCSLLTIIYESMTPLALGRGIFTTTHIELFKTRRVRWSTAPQSDVARRPKMAPPRCSKPVGSSASMVSNGSLSSVSTRQGLSSRAQTVAFGFGERVGLRSGVLRGLLRVMAP